MKKIIKENKVLGEEDENTMEGEKQLRDWERGMASMKRVEELRGRVDLGRGVAKTTPSKRPGSGEKSPTKKSRRKYPLLSQDWGEEYIPSPIW